MYCSYAKYWVVAKYSESIWNILDAMDREGFNPSLSMLYLEKGASKRTEGNYNLLHVLISLFSFLKTIHLVITIKL